MSELKGVRSQSPEEEELRNLLKVRDTIDDLLDEIDKVVNTTENALLYVTAHKINDTYSKILDEVREEPNFTNSINRTYNNKDDFVWTVNKHVRLVEGVDKTVGKGEDHSEDVSNESFSLQLRSKPQEKPKTLVSFEKNVNCEPASLNLIKIKSISSQKTKTCGEGQQYFSNIEEFPLPKNTSDGVGIKRPMLISPKGDHQADDNILSKSFRNLCKKRKIDFSDEVFNEVTIQQKPSTNMDINLARKNFRGPIGIPTDSIAVIFDTEIPGTSYKYPIVKPEYTLPGMPLKKLNRVGQKISLTVFGTKEYRKIRAYPYVDDCIELTDIFLAQELNEEYNKIVQGECSKIMNEEESNFLNSPNRIIKLIENSPGSSTDSSEPKLIKNILDTAKFQEITEMKQACNDFQENIQTEKHEKISPTHPHNLWNDVDNLLPFQAEPEMQDSILFSDIVPLQVQTDVEMLNIRKNANCEEEHLTQCFNNDIECLDPISSCKSNPLVFFNVSSSQLKTSSDTLPKFDNEIKVNESVSDELPVYSSSNLNPYTSAVFRFDASPSSLDSDMPFSNIDRVDRGDMSKILNTDDVNGEHFTTIFKDQIDKEIKANESISDELLVYSLANLTPYTSAVFRFDASPTRLESDMSFSNMHREDQGDMSKILGTDDVDGEHFTTIFKDKTKLNNEPTNTLHVSEKNENNIGSFSCQINTKETNTLYRDQIFSLSDDCFVNNFKQKHEIDDNSSLDSDDVSIASISTITVNNDFDNESDGSTTDTNKTVPLIVCGNFAFISNELHPNSTLDNPNERDIKSFNNQNSIFNDSTVAFNIENIKYSGVLKSEKFEDVVEAAKIKNVEENVAKSSYNQDEDIVIVSDFSVANLTNTPELKKENIPKSINNKDDDIVYLSDTDNEKDISCKTDSMEVKNITKSGDKQNKVTVNLSDCENNFSSNTNIIPHENHKQGCVAKFDDEDIINLSDSSICSNNEFLENISKHPINQHDIVNLSDFDNYSSDNNSISYKNKALETKNVAKPLFNQAEANIELANSSSDSIISIGSSDDQDDVICDSSHTNIACNYNTSSLIDCSTNFKNYKSISDLNHQIINISDNRKDIFSSPSNGNNFSCANMPFKATETNKQVKKSNEDGLDFSNNKKFSSDVDIPCSKSDIEHFFAEFLDGQIKDGACNSINASNNANFSKNSIFSKNTNFSKNITQSPIENFDGENIAPSSHVYGDSDMETSDIDKNDPFIEENVPVASKLIGNFQEFFFDQNQNAAVVNDTSSASPHASYSVSSNVNFNNNITFFNSTNIDCGKNMLSSTSETFENIDEFNISILRVDGQEDESISTSNNSISISGNDNMGPCKSEAPYINENIPNTENFKESCLAKSALLDHNKSIKTVNFTATAFDAESSNNSVSYIADLKDDKFCVNNDLISFNGTNISSDQKISSTNVATSVNFIKENVASLSYQNGSTDITNITSVANTLISSNNFEKYIEASKEKHVLKHSPNYHIDGTSAKTSPMNVGTSVCSTNADVATEDEVTAADIFSSENILTTEPVEDQSKSANNQYNVEGASMSIEIVGINNYANPIISPKSSIMEQISKYPTFPYNQHCSNQNISNIVSNSSVNSSAISDLKIYENLGLQKVDLSSAFDTKPETSKKTENTLTSIKKILELPHINSEIGVRPSLVNETSHNVPNLNTENASQTYVPTININADFVPQRDNRNFDVNQNCTITSNEYSEVDVWNSNNKYNSAEKFTKNVGDNFEKELKPITEVSDLTVQTNLLLDVAPKSSLTPLASPSHDVLKHHTETHDRSNTASSTSKAPVLSSKVTTGVKRLAPSTNENKSNKRYKTSSSNNLIHQTQPSTSKKDPVLNDNLDANEIADNNDPKWRLFKFSQPRDFFLAVRNQWCVPMPNPHTDFTRRHYNKKPINFTKYMIPGNQRDLKVECLDTYEEQLHQINTKSTNLKCELDMYGQYWSQRRINYTMNQVRKLDDMHDMLRVAWDDAYQFYTFSKEPKTNHSAWYMSQFNKNEIMRSVEMLGAYENFYGSLD